MVKNEPRLSPTNKNVTAEVASYSLFYNFIFHYVTPIINSEEAG